MSNIEEFKIKVALTNKVLLTIKAIKFALTIMVSNVSLLGNQNKLVSRDFLRIDASNAFMVSLNGHTYLQYFHHNQ